MRQSKRIRKLGRKLGDVNWDTQKLGNPNPYENGNRLEFRGVPN